MAATRFPKKAFSPLRCATIIMTLCFLSTCAEVPVTGRKGLHLMPKARLLTLSFQQYGRVLKQSKLSKDQKSVQMVRRVEEKSAGAAGSRSGIIGGSMA